MKKVLLLFVILISAVFLGCDSKTSIERASRVAKEEAAAARVLDACYNYFEQPHLLRKVVPRVEQVKEEKPAKANLSGGFFLFMGGVNGTYESGSVKEYIVTNVKFAWNTGDSSYMITTLPLNKIRVKIVEKIEFPTISFFLDRRKVGGANCYHKSNTSVWFGPLWGIVSQPKVYTEELLNFLLYAEITCNSRDWPTEIKLPQLQDM